MKIKIVFLGTSPFVQTIKEELSKHFELVNSLADANLGVVASYGKILTKSELNTPKHGCINIHPSLLPKYRGPSPIQTAILNGDKVSGITIIKMDEEIDHGPIIFQEQFKLSDSDNFDILSKKMFQRASEVLPHVIEDFISGKIRPLTQNHDISTFCDKLTRDSGYFDLPARLAAKRAGRQVLTPEEKEELNRKIRAYYPWPGVWCKWKMENEKWKIVKFLPNGLIQMEGKKAISVKDFLNGYSDFPLSEI